MTNTAAIATKLNVQESVIVRVEEWFSVMFVVVKGLGARFVTKKIGKMKLTTDKQSDMKWVCRSEVPTANKYFTDNAWVSISRSGITGESKESPGTKAPSDELRAYAIEQVAKLASIKPAQRITPTISSGYKSYRRTTCINCDITTHILMGRGYCTDCHGECD